MKAVGSAITNFSLTLPDYQSDLAQCAFKDPYNFSFIGTMALHPIITILPLFAIFPILCHINIQK